jgi:hypothetical protein
MEELLACQRRALGGALIGEVGRPGPTGLGGLVPLPGSVFSILIIFTLRLMCPRAPQVAPPKFSHPLLCLNYWSFHLMPLLWVMSMLLCFICHLEFPAKRPMLVLCMWPGWKLLEGHPVMHRGACMIFLTRLPPSKHVSRLSTPLISKIKNKFRAMRELKHKFRVLRH